MKTTTLLLILFSTTLELWAQPSPSPRRLPQHFNLATNAPADSTLPTTPGLPPAAVPAAPAASNAAPTAAPAATKIPEEMIPAGNINFQGVDVSQVLDVYAQLVGRTVLRAGLPPAQIILRTETPLTKTEAIQALQAVLALNGIALVNVGDKFVKVLPVEQANSAGAKINHGEASQLPEMGSYVTHIVQLKYVKPTIMMPIIQPFAKLPNSILAIDDNGILVLRDNAENVKRMLEMIDQVDVSVPAEYISEVIPIKYAMADDIANALNSLGGSGGGTTSFGGSTAASPINGVKTQSGGGTTPGTAGQSQPNQTRALGSQTTAGGAPTGGTTFQQRLQSIIQRAGAGGKEEPIQVFGQTKIIADQRSNSLLIFATRQDMEKIKQVISELDVLLSQVLIESVIIDYSLGPNTLNFGVSAAQNPQTYSQSLPAIGAGGVNNGQPLLSFLNGSSGSTNGTTGIASSLASGLNYFGNIGPHWEVALQAAAADSHASIVQRPRIQTSQAKAAQFFVGETVPYVTGSTYGSAYGNSSSYSQLSVGVELDVTPFINPDGLVVMDINQEIDDINGYTQITGVGNVPNTDKRTLSSEVAVRDRDTIMLGGFVRGDKSTSRSGVPFLMNIPILGNLFTSRSDSKDRTELIVLIRPTVLRTPELAAAQAVKEQRRLPGVSAVVAEDARNERKQIEAEERDERIAAQKEAQEAQREAKARKQGTSTPTTVTPTNNVGSLQPDPNAAWH
ncbi:MAG: secretin N-terminal domain-containing protein [Limisphaerales bacterium]